MSYLEIKGVSKDFKGLRAVDRVDLFLREGEILGLIGPNGAGKTTLFNLITNVFPLTQGKIFWKGENITGLRTDLIAEKGILRTFQIPRIFPHISIYENLLVGCHKHTHSGIFDAFLRTRRFHQEEEVIMEKANEILQFFGIESKREMAAGNLPYGEMKKLAIAIVMAAEPELMLIDEPASGLNPNETIELMDLIYKIRERGIGILLVDHDMRFVMELCERIAVLNYGRKIAEGSPEEIQSNDAVIKAYLGSRKNA